MLTFIVYLAGTFLLLSLIGLLMFCAYVLLLGGELPAFCDYAVVVIIAVAVLVGSFCLASADNTAFWAEKLNWEPTVSTSVITVEKLEPVKGKYSISYILTGHDTDGTVYINDDIDEELFAELNVGDTVIVTTTVREGKVLFLHLRDENVDISKSYSLTEGGGQ